MGGRPCVSSRQDYFNPLLTALGLVLLAARSERLLLSPRRDSAKMGKRRHCRPYVYRYWRSGRSRKNTPISDAASATGCTTCQVCENSRRHRTACRTEVQLSPTSNPSVTRLGVRRRYAHTSRVPVALLSSRSATVTMASQVRSRPSLTGKFYMPRTRSRGSP